MAESENKRTRRTPQERAAEVDEKIAKIDQSIKELESKRNLVWQSMMRRSPQPENA